STIDDLHSFARMLLAGGTVDGRPLLSSASVREMMTDHLTRSQRDASGVFLGGQGWGFGGSGAGERLDFWGGPCRFGWVGGTGTNGPPHPVPAARPPSGRAARRGRDAPHPPGGGIWGPRGPRLKTAAKKDPAARRPRSPNSAAVRGRGCEVQRA